MCNCACVLVLSSVFSMCLGDALNKTPFEVLDSYLSLFSTRLHEILPCMQILIGIECCKTMPVENLNQMISLVSVMLGSLIELYPYTMKSAYLNRTGSDPI